MSFSVSGSFESRIQEFANCKVSFGDRMQALKQQRQTALARGMHLPSIAILGAGPAGLSRAIDALVTGNPVTVIEKRKDNCEGRANVVHIKTETLPFLKYHGIYQYLLEKGLIFCEDRDGFSVPIKELEAAMKAVISELTQEDVIRYNTQVENIIRKPGDKVDLKLKNEGQSAYFNGVDVLIVAEGKNSTTNESLLGNHRVEVLPSIPVIAAIYKDNRPYVTGIFTLCQYTGQSLSGTATSVYYYTLFFFKCVFQREHIFNEERRIAGSLILKTPHQHYVGCGLSKEETKEMNRLSTQVASAKRELQTARSENRAPGDISALEQKAASAEAEWKSYVQYWAAMGFCFANVLKVFLWVIGESDIRRSSSDIASWHPLNQFFIAEIGADKSSAYSGSIGQTSYLIAGDTLATVDPTTGLGCNTAIQTTVDFHRYMEGVNSRQNIGTLLQNYNRRCDQVISRIHSESKRSRQAYRPDAVY